MNVEHIGSRKNPFVRHLLKLSKEREYRRECAEFLAEGTKLYFDAREKGAEITAVCTPPGAELPVCPGARRVTLSEHVFSLVSTQKTPQGVLFCCRLPGEALPECVPGQGTVFLDGVQDPGNVGAVLRTAAAFGISHVLVSDDSSDPYSPKAVRASMGGIFKTRALVLKREELSGLLCRSGLSLSIAEPSDENAEDIRCASLENVCVAVGSEGGGVSALLREAAEKSVCIPMEAGSESLNAALSAGIILWEMARGRFEGQIRPTTGLIEGGM